MLQHTASESGVNEKTYDLRGQMIDDCAEHVVEQSSIF